MSVQETLKAAAQQAVLANDGRASVITTASGKRYAVINITRERTLGKLPEDARIQSLAKQIIESHEHKTSSLQGKEIAYIDSTGAHYTDEAQTAHKDVSISQEKLHEATSGLSGKHPESVSPDQIHADHQFTKEQESVLNLEKVIHALPKDSGVLTVSEVKAEIAEPHLPKEFKEAFTAAITGKGDLDTITRKDLYTAFDQAYWGEDKRSGYIGRLRDEHLAGAKDSTHQVFNDGFEDLFSENLTYDLELHDLNVLTAPDKTAQHAWNALEALSRRVDETIRPIDLSGLGLQEGQLIVSLDEEDSSLRIPEASRDLVLLPLPSDRVEQARELEEILRPTLVADAEKYGLLRGKDADSISNRKLAEMLKDENLIALVQSPDDPPIIAAVAKDRLEMHELQTQVLEYGLYRDEEGKIREDFNLVAQSKETLTAMLTPEALLQAVQNKKLEPENHGIDQEFSSERVGDLRRALIDNELEMIVDEFSIEVNDRNEEGYISLEALKPQVLAGLQKIADDERIDISQCKSAHQIAAEIMKARRAQSHQDSHSSMAQRTGQALLTGVKSPFQAVAHPLVTGGRVLSAVAHPLQTLSSVGENLSWWWRGDPVKSEE
ncbi:MAG: hypothetical protein AB7N99_03910 [Simkaniaceae bacterium]